MHPSDFIPLFGIAAGILITVTGTIGWVIVESRKAARGVAPRELAQIDARLQRIEQAVDAMSIEVERISEGQRFTTKLLADRSGIADRLPTTR